MVKNMRIHIRLLLYLLLVAILFSGCSNPSFSTDEDHLTQDIGEEPPTYHQADDLVSTPTFTPQTPLPNPKATEAALIGPGSYPTPGDQVTPWDQLINRKLIEGFQWETYRGTFQGVDKSTYWSYSFRYPAVLYPSNQESLNQGYVQSIPPTQGQTVQGAFIKFEVVTLKDPPMIDAGEVIDPQNFHTVMIAGQPGVLRVNTQVPDRIGVVSAVFAYTGGLVAAAGYITLPSVDPASFEIWTTVMFEILSDFKIQDQ